MADSNLATKYGLVNQKTLDALRVLGRLDAREGIDRYDGWKAVCAEAGFDEYARTPAAEAYLDGWFEGLAGK